MHLYEITIPGKILKKYYKIRSTRKEPKIHDFLNADIVISKNKLYNIDAQKNIVEIDTSIDNPHLLSAEQINDLLENMQQLHSHTYIVMLGLIRNLVTSYHEAVYCYYNYYSCSKLNIVEYTEMVEQKLEDKLSKMKKSGIEEIYNGLDPFEYNAAQKREAKRILWSQGVMPVAIKRHEKYIYAKMFIFSLDNIYKFISVLNKEYPEKNIINEIQCIDDQFPYLIALRNSAHHIEDRIRGIGQYSKKIAYDITNEEANLGMVTNCTSGNEFFTTLGDGSIGSIDISSDTLCAFRGYIESILSKFKWQGNSHVKPY